MGEKTTPVNFRMPNPEIEFLEKYANFLSLEAGTKITKTQALVKLMSIAKPEEERRMLLHQALVSKGFSGFQEYQDWRDGVESILASLPEGRLDRPTKGKPIRQVLWDSFLDAHEARYVAIQLGRDIRTGAIPFEFGEGRTLLSSISGSNHRPRHLEIEFGLKLLAEAESAADASISSGGEMDR